MTRSVNQKSQSLFRSFFYHIFSSRWIHFFTFCDFKYKMLDNSSAMYSPYATNVETQQRYVYSPIERMPPFAFDVIQAPTCNMQKIEKYLHTANDSMNHWHIVSKTKNLNGKTHFNWHGERCSFHFHLLTYFQ